MTISLIWVLMVGTSLVFSFFTNSLSQCSLAFLEGSNTAIQISLTLAGPLCLWSGVMKLLEQSGGTKGIAKVLSPVLGKIFPLASQSPNAMGYLCANVSANLLGLGNAATPMGIQAVGAMKRINPEGVALGEIYRLVVVNTASIQLLPTTLIALRSSAGCQTPWDVLPGVWVTSLCALGAGLLAIWLLQRIWG